jgi:SM-20-related protein
VLEGEVRRLGAEGYFVRDGFLGEEAALGARREAEARIAEARPAGVSRGPGHRFDPAIRGDQITWITDEEAGPLLAPLIGRFAALRAALNRDAWLGLDRCELQLARYPGDGARYARHLDAFPGGPNRRVTAIYYMNPGWRPEHGGALRLHGDAAPVDIAPLLDRLVVFLSARLEHEVLPAAAPRLAVTAWYYGRDALPLR